MVTIYSMRKNSLGEKTKLMVELRGLSTDTKPKSFTDGDIENGSVFIEMDTQDVYMYNAHSKQWIKPVEENAGE